MHARLREAFTRELAQGHECLSRGSFGPAYRHFERAHVLGQRWVVPHTRSHWAFLIWGWKCMDGREVIGQLLRIPAGIVGSALGRVPVGNTGGARVSALRRMPIPGDLKRLMEDS